ncbi:MAG: magnesium transporter CorA family protein, partial [Planctomycetes bacterium]|nr:magnesium transporter CorA family protein [Planctomycetota bacterium]
MQRKYRIVDRKLVETEDGSATVTVFVNPTPDERKLLVDELKIDEHNLVSALDPDELSRIEFEPQHHAIIYSRPQNYCDKERFLFKCGTVGAFLFKDRLAVVVSEDVPLFDSVQISRVQTPAGLLLKLILGAVIHFRG